MGFISESGKLPIVEVEAAAMVAYKASREKGAGPVLAAMFPARKLSARRGKGAALILEVSAFSLNKAQLATILELQHPDCKGCTVEVTAVGKEVVTITRHAPEQAEAAKPERVPQVDREQPLDEEGDES